VSRYDIRENERHNRQSLSVFSRRKRPKERETYARRRERLRTRLRFSSDFASPPKSFSPIEIRKHAKERKKERTMRYILLSFFRVVVYIVLMNYVKSVVSASVSLGQFYRYLVRIHHGTQNDLRSNSILTTTTKKVKSNERRTLKESKKEHTYKRTVCVRCSNEQIVVISIRRRERCVHGSKCALAELNFCEV